MPNFHLHLYHSHIQADDREGHDLPDLEAAHKLALAGIRDFLAHEAFNGKIDFRGQIDIEDDGGNVLKVVPFRDALTIIGL